MKRRKVGVYYNSENTSGCDYYRAILPVRHCREALARRGVDLELTDSSAGIERFDAILVHRNVTDAFLRDIVYFLSTGKKVAWDHDDLLTDMPPWNPVRAMFTEEFRRTWEALKHSASLRWVSTKRLSELSGLFDRRGRPYSDTRVLPNLVDLDDYLPYRPQTRHDKVVILWAGSETHSEDLKRISEPLKKVIDRNNGRVEVRFFGAAPSELVVSHFGKIHLQRKCEVQNYPKVLCALRPDIGLAPLADHPFNEAKSDCKAIEYAAAGAIPVTQDAPPYRANGLCRLASDDWDDQVQRLVSLSDAERRELVADSDAVLRESHSWQSEAKRSEWVDAFRELFDEIL